MNTNISQNTTQSMKSKNGKGAHLTAVDTFDQLIVGQEKIVHTIILKKITKNISRQSTRYTEMLIQGGTAQNFRK